MWRDPKMKSSDMLEQSENGVVVSTPMFIERISTWALVNLTEKIKENGATYSLFVSCLCDIFPAWVASDRIFF